MRTTAHATRKPRVAPAMPFHVPPPFDKILKEATVKVEEVADQTRDAATRFEHKVRSAATTMKKQGESWAKDPKAFALKMTSDVSKEATRLADEVTTKVTDAVGEMIEVSLHKMNVPTLHELQMLGRKVDLLSKKIDTMAVAKARRVRRVRRTR
jgi:predicted P-loop ATPase/GTPase